MFAFVTKRDTIETLLYSPEKHAAIRTEEYLYNQLIPYIGNKRKLLWLIAEAVRKTGITTGTFLDLFSGSSAVSRFAKYNGFRVIANDWEPYGNIINQCYVACNNMPRFNKLGGAQTAFQVLNDVEPLEGYIATHLCPRDDDNLHHGLERMFYTHRNGAKMDAMRERLSQWEAQCLIDVDERAVILAAMVYSASYVSNTSGVFKAFHRGWGGKTKTALYRILSDVFLRMPILHDNKKQNEVFDMDAQHLAAHLSDARIPVDIAYIDPPYNQHPYGANYHVLNTVVLWDKPELSPEIAGRNKSAIRADWRTERRSAYNYASASAAYTKLIQTINATHILTSYSTDGNIPLREMLSVAAERGGINCVKKPYKRYRVSAQRTSSKPMNVEFVLAIDTTKRSVTGSAERLYNEIMEAERAALNAHSETTTFEQKALA